MPRNNDGARRPRTNERSVADVRVPRRARSIALVALSTLARVSLPSVAEASFACRSSTTTGPSRRDGGASKRATTVSWSSFFDPTGRGENEDPLRDRTTERRVVEALFRPSPRSSSSSSGTIDLTLAGVGRLDSTLCAFLAPVDATFRAGRRSSSNSNNNNDDSVLPAAAVPLDPAALNLLTSAYRRRPMSKSRCLALNPVLVNRDDGLFDGLPWATWSVANDRDAAGNVVDVKYRLGKRDAYDRFLGKDWPGRSLSIGNTAQRMLYLLEGDDDDDDRDAKVASLDEEAALALAERVAELDLREARERLAELEERAAVSERRAEDLSTVEAMMLEEDAAEVRYRIEEILSTTEELEETRRRRTLRSPSSLATLLLTAVVELNNRNPAPYRGAYGYAPFIDDKNAPQQPYEGPYDLLREIVREQLRADVIGVVLENTYLLDEEDRTVVFGGACVLKRRRELRTMVVDGETVEVLEEYVTEEEDAETKERTANDEPCAGDVVIAECDADEAVGLALAAGETVLVDRELWERSNLWIRRVESSTSTGIPEAVVVEEERGNVRVVDARGNERDADSSRTTPGPSTTASLFSDTSSSSMFDDGVADLVRSLSDLDAMTNAGKARALLSLRAFQGRLPRPRVLRANPDLLTDLLLPYVDESVRREYNVREAERNGDSNTAQRLRDERSRRQIARENAETAETEDEAEAWGLEADLYAALRADVTQDEGGYDRFLDKDEWYERDRRAQAKNAKKSDFGTLLDGIE